ncbi:hypothetical protein GJ496_004364 [Pomphorhynchus laevis]|nr:hypothetical protein GJ496_004364 [Pomphorhynchus laevis]
MYQFSTLNFPNFIGNLHGRGRFSDEDRQRFEQSQTQSAQKILTPIECQPKEKHVRNIILGTFHEEGAHLFWTLISKGFQFETNHVIGWKFLYLYHRILRDGHKNVITDSMPVISYIGQLGVFWHSLPNRFGSMLEKYCDLLSRKMYFHDKHRFVPGNLQIKFNDFQGEVGRSTDAYFEISADVMDYLDCILDFQKSVFASIHQDGTFSHTAQGQCRLSPLVCCIQEANCLYDLLVKMLFEMHTALKQGDLDGHHTRFRSIFKKLQKFYHISTSYKFLKDLLVIPALTKEPNFLLKDDIDNYKSPVCVLNVVDEVQNRQDVNDVAANSEYDYPLTPWWINRTFSEPAENVYVSYDHTVSVDKPTLDTRPRSPEDSADLFSLDSSMFENVTNSNVEMTTQQHIASSETRLAEEINQLKQELLNKDKVLQSTQSKLLLLEASIISNTSQQAQAKELQNKCLSFEKKYEQMKSMYADLRDKHVSVLKEISELRKKSSNSKLALIDTGIMTESFTSDSDGELKSHLSEINEEFRQRIQILFDDKAQLEDSIRNLEYENKELKAIISKEEDNSNCKKIDGDLVNDQQVQMLTQRCRDFEDRLTKMNEQKQYNLEILKMNRSNITLLRDSKMEMESKLVDAVHDFTILESNYRSLEKKSSHNEKTIELLMQNLKTTQDLRSLELEEIPKLISVDIAQICKNSITFQEDCLQKYDQNSVITLLCDIQRFSSLIVPASSEHDRVSSVVLVRLLQSTLALMHIHRIIHKEKAFSDLFARSIDLECSQLCCSVKSLFFYKQYDYQHIGNSETMNDNQRQGMNDDLLDAKARIRSSIVDILHNMKDLDCFFEDSSSDRSWTISQTFLSKTENIRCLQLVEIFSNMRDILLKCTEAFNNDTNSSISSRALFSTALTNIVIQYESVEKVCSFRDDDHVDVSELFILKRSIHELLSFVGLACSAVEHSLSDFSRLVQQSETFLDLISSPIKKQLF